MISNRSRLMEHKMKQEMFTLSHYCMWGVFSITIRSSMMLITTACSYRDHEGIEKLADNRIGAEYT